MNSEEFLKQIDLKEDKKNKLFKINGGEKIYIYNDTPLNIIQHDEIYKILYNTYAKALCHFWHSMSVNKEGFIMLGKEDTVNYMFDKLFVEILKEVDKLRNENREVFITRKRDGYYSFEVDFDYALIKLNCTYLDCGGLTVEFFDGVKRCNQNEYDQ